LEAANGIEDFIMLKQTIFAAGLCALALSAAPASAQDVRSGGGCPAASRGHVKVFDGNNVAAARRSGGVRVAVGDVNGDGASGTTIKKATLFVRKAGGKAEAQPGSEAGVPRSQSQNNLKQVGLASKPDTTEVGGMDILDGVPGESSSKAAATARMKCQNNLKQLGTAHTGQ
jgi:hypothetical protein